MNVLVTGGAGYVGSVLVPKLLEKGHNVTTLDNLVYNRNPQGLLAQVEGRPLLSHPRFYGHIKKDVRDFSAVKAATRGQDAVIHLAAIVGAPSCDKHKDVADDVNFGGTLNVIKALGSDLEQGKKVLIYSSTGSNYGKVKEVCTEETPLNPLSLYGETKTKAEKATLENGGIAYRFATGFGVSPRLRLDLLVNDFTYQVVRNEHLDVFQGHVRRTFIHVRDMADAFVAGLEHSEKMVGQPFNVGDESLNITKREIAETIGRKVPAARIYISKEDDDPNSYVDPDKRDYDVSYRKVKALSEDFHVKVTLDEGIDELIAAASIIENPDFYKNV